VYPRAEEPGIFIIQSGGEFLHQPFYLPHQPFGNCWFPTRVLPFWVTDEQHVRIMWFTRSSSLSTFGVGPRTHISFVGCLVFLTQQRMLDTRQRCWIRGLLHLMFNNYIGLHIALWRAGRLDSGVPVVTPASQNHALLSWCPVTLS